MSGLNLDSHFLPAWNAYNNLWHIIDEFKNTNLCFYTHMHRNLDCKHIHIGYKINSFVFSQYGIYEADIAY